MGGHGAFVMFAPSYWMANYGLMADALKGGMRGSLARETMEKMLMGGLFLYAAVAHRLGQKPNLDPTGSKFLKVKIGGTTVGLDSPDRALRPSNRDWSSLSVIVRAVKVVLSDSNVNKWVGFIVPIPTLPHLGLAINCFHPLEVEVLEHRPHLGQLSGVSTVPKLPCRNHLPEVHRSWL